MLIVEINKVGHDDDSDDSEVTVKRGGEPPIHIRSNACIRKVRLVEQCPEILYQQAKSTSKKEQEQERGVADTVAVKSDGPHQIAAPQFRRMDRA